jgi:hypothetical protein
MSLGDEATEEQSGGQRRITSAVTQIGYARSKKLREACLILYQNCGRDDGTVCCAHSKW